jgi:hypothetical protein
VNETTTFADQRVASSGVRERWNCLILRRFPKGVPISPPLSKQHLPAFHNELVSFSRFMPEFAIPSARLVENLVDPRGRESRAGLCQIIDRFASHFAFPPTIHLLGAAVPACDSSCESVVTIASCDRSNQLCIPHHNWEPQRQSLDDVAQDSVARSADDVQSHQRHERAMANCLRLVHRLNSIREPVLGVPAIRPLGRRCLLPVVDSRGILSIVMASTLCPNHRTCCKEHWIS